MRLIFAHRGFASRYSENTMSSFLQAERAGADGIELDVQLTKDGVPVVIHDEKVDRTTDGKGLVRDFTFRDIRRLNADFKKASGKGKETIPALEEVFDWLKGTGLQCNIELKNSLFPYRGMEETVIGLVQKYGYNDRVILSSFNHYSLVHCFRLAPWIETAPLYSEIIYMPWVYAESIGAKGIHPRHIHASGELIADSTAHGIAVRPYTVNDRQAMERLFEAGCPAIITDNPALAVEIGQKKGKRL